MTPDDRFGMHLAGLERVIGFTRVADAKAAPLLALQASLVGVALPSVHDMSRLMHTGWPSWESPLACSLAMLYGIMSCVSWLLAASVYVPRTPRDIGSVLYFEEIRRISATDFQKSVLSLDERGWEEQILRQTHAISRVASLKFACVRWSFISGSVGLAAWVFLMVWVRV
jgi:hypothetical protein